MFLEMKDSRARHIPVMFQRGGKWYCGVVIEVSATKGIRVFGKHSSEYVVWWMNPQDLAAQNGERKGYVWYCARHQEGGVVDGVSGSERRDAVNICLKEHTILYPYCWGFPFAIRDLRFSPPVMVKRGDT
jgi:hypothetical protein